jgi:Zn-dependent protease
MDIPSIIVQIFVVLFAITVHEASHGWAAAKMGDFTAQSMGRVSLNPVVHIDPIGTVLLPLLLILAHQPAFGWAKPVPVNPYNLRHPRRDHLWISFAGPIANLLAAAISAGLFLMVKAWVRGMTTSSMMVKPIVGLADILLAAFTINMVLAVFNLIPVPPLDGSGILSGLLSDSAAAKYDRIRPYGFILIIALAYTRILDFIFIPIGILRNYLIR